MVWIVENQENEIMEREPIEKIKKKIIELYSKPPNYYTSELVDRFEVPPRLILIAIKELKEEGKLMS